MCGSLIQLLISAVMHDLRLIHTDLKPENILLVSSDYIKIPDYKVHFTKTTDATMEIFLLLFLIVLKDQNFDTCFLSLV